MKRRWRSIIVGIVAAAIVAGAAAGEQGAPTDPAATADARQAAAASAGTVAITPRQQAASGIEVRVLPLTSYQPQTGAYGSVLDPGPLFELRGQLRSAQAQTDAALSQAAASEREYRRLALLNSQDRNVSDRAAEAARAAWEADRARLESAQATLSGVRDTARSRWGDVLVRWALAAHSPRFDAFNSGQEALLMVALPRSAPAGSPSPAIRIGLPGTGGGEIKARLVSPSPVADPVIQGPTYFYLAPRGVLRAGMRIEAFLPAGKSLKGVMIPSSAVVWYANRPWVYVQSDSAHFVRRAIAVDTPAPGGWFAAPGWRGGERIAVKGAALLFSEEFQPKPQPGSPVSGDDDDG